MKTKTFDPLEFVKKGIDIFNLLHTENKNKSYKDKFEAFNHVLANKLIGQAIALYSLREKGIEYEFEGRTIALADSNSAINIFRGILETYLTWNYIYSYSNNENQKRAKFILWNLDGIRTINQFENNPNKA